jgi:sulfur dioxygenase
MLFRQLFDKESSSYTYLIADINIQEAVLVDPVLEQINRDLALLKELGLSLIYCLETHLHADRITATGKLREYTGCLGFVPEKAGATYADRNIKNGEMLKVGKVQIEAISTPGHTDSDMSYLVDNTHLLTGDALFIRGCGRTDFQNGNSGILYDSVTQRLFSLPDKTLVYPAHDYRGHTISTIGEERKLNPRFSHKSRDEFIEFMDKLNLPMPHKIMEALPANKGCGNLDNVA